MWIDGCIQLPIGSGRYEDYKYVVKYSEKPSKHGLDGGRILKLVVTHKDKLVMSYDGGWDKKPSTQKGYVIICILIEDYN